MSRMLDLIRASAVTSHQMMSASKGALHVPPTEMLQILIYLAENNKIYGEQARLTLAGWDATSCKELAADPDTPAAILDYWVAPKNLRPELFSRLVENRSVSMTKLGELGSTVTGELIDLMIASRRVRSSMPVLTDMSTNHHLTGSQAARIQGLINPVADVEPAAELKPEPALEVAATNAVPEEHSLSADPETDKVVAAFLTAHAVEIAADAHKPFQPIGGIYEEESPSEQPAAAEATTAESAAPVSLAASATGAAAAVRPALAAKPSAPRVAHVNPEDEKRGSVLQKITKLDIKGRIQLAMKGSKEERSILVRDGTKLVALAVLDSPKISDGEVEKIAAQKNVLEAVLRAIPMKRRFVKNYAVVRNLVGNPRTPLDIGLGLMKNLLVADLKNLSGNKEVSETIRKLALRQFKQKSEPGGGRS